MGEIIKTIKNLHFNFEEMKYDYNTVMDSFYEFDPNTTKNVRDILDRK